MSDFGEYLKELRGKRSLRDVQKGTGISHTYLSTLEKGFDPRTGNVRNPTPDILRKLATFYNVDYLHLLNEAGHINEVEKERLINAAQAAAKLNNAPPMDKQDILINPEKFPDPIAITKSIKVPSQYKIDGKTRNFINSDILDLYYLIEMSKGHSELLNLKYKGEALTGEDKQKILSIIDTLLK